MRKALAQPHTKQFLKFAVVGLISFGIDWGMLIALVELFHLDFFDEHHGFRLSRPSWSTTGSA